MTVIGDSLSEAYTNRDYGTLPNHGKCWTQILSDTGRVDLGQTPEQAGIVWWDDDRGINQQHNWAHYAFDTSNALSYELHGPYLVTGAVWSVQQGQTYAGVLIGGNDLNPFRIPMTNMYNGTWTMSQGSAFVAGVVQNVRTMVIDLKTAGAHVILASPNDFQIMPYMQIPNQDLNKRAIGTEMFRMYRDGLRKLAIEQHIVFLDLFRLNNDLFGDANHLKTTFLVGNVPIHAQQYGDTGDKAFCVDSIHHNRVPQAIWANGFLAAINIVGNENIIPISETEILAIGGLTYGGQDTLNQSLHPMPFYVQNFECIADFNSSGTIEVQDIMDFLNAWFEGDIRAAMGQNVNLTTQDIFIFLSAWFSGC